MNKTKIVCTLGPASRDPKTLDALLARGMDVARLNFSHGSHDEHRTTLERVRAAASRAGRQIAILQDLQGPKIRVGALPNGSVQLSAGEHVEIVTGDVPLNPGVIPTTYEKFSLDVNVGNTILMDDGLIRLRVEAVKDERVRCLVEVGGELKSRKGINLPGVDVSAPALSAKDLDDLTFGAELGVDFVCLSFVRRASDIEEAAAHLDRLNRRVPIIAKIEKPEAVDELEAILDAADGIMVARGDLGVEMGPEKVPLLQKHCIEEANRRGKLVITATQMLESMITSAFPTRAEASDVANAVLDNTDAVMLSGETATGRHPELVVHTMRSIIEEIEGSERFRKLAQLPPLDLGMTANAIARAAAAAASTLPNVEAIVCISDHGITPTLLSDYRPNTPIYALTKDPAHCRRLSAFWGVWPILFEHDDDWETERTIAAAEACLIERKLVSPGDKLVLTMAVPAGKGLHTNTLKIHKIGGRLSC